MSDSANPEVIFWIDELMVKETDPWRGVLIEYLRKDTGNEWPYNAIEVKKRQNPQLNEKFIEELCEDLKKAEKPRIAIVMAGTRDVMLALEESPEKQAEFLEQLDSYIEGLLSTFRSHPQHGLLLIGAFPLDEPQEGSHSFSLEKYDALAHKINSLLMTRVQDQLVKQWNIAFESPCSFFCLENRQLADGIYGTDGLSLTQGALNHFVESAMRRVDLLNHSRQKGLDLLTRVDQSCPSGDVPQ